VNAYRLVARDLIEEKILRPQQSKRAGTGMPAYRDIYMEEEEPAPSPPSRSCCAPRMRRRCRWRILRKSSRSFQCGAAALGGDHMAASAAGA
jgi:hypothetical protein